MWIPEDTIQEEAWLHGLGIAFLELAALVAICYLGLVVFFFSKREIGIGVLCTFFFVCTGLLPFGVLLALVFGWLKAAQWGLKAFMAVWTLLVVMTALNLVALLMLR